MSCVIRMSCAPPRSISASPPTSDRSNIVELALKFVEQNASPFKPEVYKNSYQEALLALIKEKSKGKKIRAPETEPSRPSARNVVDLMEAQKKREGRQQEPRAAGEEAPRKEGWLAPLVF
jgi:DNA end-binding protein Ku